MSFKYQVEIILFNGLINLVKILPEKAVVNLGRGFGSLCFHLGVRRKVVNINLRIAFRDTYSTREFNQLAKKVYRNVASVFFEVILMKFIPRDTVGDYIQIKGLDILDEAISEGRGVVMAGAHFDHWELLSAGIAATGRPLCGYAGLQKNSQFDGSLNEIRQKFGLETISKSKTATRQMLKVLRGKKILGILGDLNVPHDNLFVDFFNKKAVFGIGLPTFTVMRKAPLLFIWSTRVGPLKHEGHIIRLNYALKGDQESDVQHVAQVISSQLEKTIKQYPDQYFWFNKRWKTRPPEEKVKEKVYP